MNIAIFTPSQNPYSETFIQAHKNYLKGQVFYYYGGRGRIRLEAANSLVSKWALLRLRLVRKIKKYSFSYINEEAVLASLKEKNIDVVLVEYGTHAFNMKDVLVKSGLPVVVHFHGYDASVHTAIKACNDYKDVFNYATKIVAVSTKMKQMLLGLGCPKEKLVYNVYGPQPEFEAVTPTFAKKQFIGIGRFTDKKAPYYTIMAFNEIAHKHPDAHLLLAGSGSLMNVCVNLVKQYQLEKQVQFLGVVTPEAYRVLLSESLGFVQHSIVAASGDMEGTPLAVLEASVSGLPVIATKHAGIPDVIIDGETGLLCEEHDVHGMANNMLQLMDDVEYAKKLGTSGKQHILRNYNIKRHIESLQNILKETADYKHTATS
ncbi:glycosyltransferase family 4 protein [Winogradskyella rapida]|uniref:Glycosyltransferase family 4 protein n=1 Tax=Winogradskyella rapida TaxID=549701 RepID=A0ABW3KR11_9FLAO